MMSSSQVSRVAAKMPVQKVLLIGGFAESVSLQRYLSDRLKNFCHQRNCPEPTLLHPPNMYVRCRPPHLHGRGHLHTYQPY